MPYFFVDKSFFPIYNGEQNQKANALKRRVRCGKIQREVRLVEAPYRKAAEDQLRAALIRSGDSVIIIFKRLNSLSSLR